jgi:hypothetical protein
MKFTDKPKKVTDETTNSRVYKMTKWQIGFSGCPICSPHRGCNRRNKKYDRNWKNFRKTQYKVRNLQFANCESTSNECGVTPHS